MKIKETVFVRRGIAGVFLRPKNPESCQLLAELFAGDLAEIGRPLQMSVPELISEIKSVAKGLGISVSICGNRQWSPVVHLWKATNRPAEPVKQAFER